MVTTLDKRDKKANVKKIIEKIDSAMQQDTVNYKDLNLYKSNNNRFNIYGVEKNGKEVNFGWEFSEKELYEIAMRLLTLYDDKVHEREYYNHALQEYCMRYTIFNVEAPRVWV